RRPPIRSGVSLLPRSIYIVHDARLLGEFSERLKKRIASGARVLIIADVNALSQTNEFLDTFGISSTPYRIMPDGYNSRIATISDDPDCFVDPVLLNGVNAVAFDSVFALRLEREA